ncbi:MAG: hypothetical protein WC099_01795 [Candidatus Paceibacterota bacterium]
MKTVALLFYIMISCGTILIAIGLKYAPQDRVPSPSDLATALYFAIVLAFFGLLALILFCYKDICEKIKKLEKNN